jgi:HAE1 family hydrophobic/amphiphilic exporter-1
MMLRIAVVACSLLLVPLNGLAGQENRGLTVEGAVAEALRHNFDVLRAEESLARLEGQIQETRSLVFPQVGLESSYARAYDEYLLDVRGSQEDLEATNNYAIRTTLDQILFSWGRVTTAIEIAEQSRVRGGFDVGSTERDVKFRVHQGFYDLLLAARLVEVAEETLKQRERQLDVAQKRFDAGVVNEFEVIRARVDVANTKTPVIQTRNGVRQAEDRLNNLMARPQGTPIQPEGELEYVPLEGLTLDGVVERAVAQRPELEALRVAQEIAANSVKLAKAEDKLEVNLAADYGYATQDFDQIGPNRERWSAALIFSLPLFDGWRTRGRVAQATSSLRDAEIAIRQLEQDVTLEAKAGLDKLEETAEIIRATSLNIGQAEKALELAETSYQYGVATFLDVTDAQLSLALARRDHARALRDYMVAKAFLLSVMNEL